MRGVREGREGDQSGTQVIWLLHEPGQEKLQLVPDECQPVGQLQPHMLNVPELNEQLTWLSQEPGHEKLQLSLVTW